MFEMLLLILDIPGPTNSPLKNVAFTFPFTVMTLSTRDTLDAPDIVFTPEYTANNPGVESVIKPVAV